MSYKAEQGTGTVDQLVAPAIDGVITRAFRTNSEGEVGIAERYYYAAIISDRVFVDIRGVLEPSSQTEQVFSDLLTKAVAAVRGA